MIERTTTLPRVAHTAPALKAIAENWSHSHGENPDGDIICVPCMAELLYDIHNMVFNDERTARTADGRTVIN